MPHRATSLTSQHLYDAELGSMDVQGGFEPTETSGFINIQAIRIKKWGEANARRGQGGVKREDVYNRK